MLSSVIWRKLPIDEAYSLRGETLADQIQKDKEKGLIPFFVKNFIYFLF